MPVGPAGRLLFAILGTDAVWKVLEKAIDTIPKVLRQPPQPTPTSSATDDFRHAAAGARGRGSETGGGGGKNRNNDRGLGERTPAPRGQGDRHVLDVRSGTGRVRSRTHPGDSWMTVGDRTPRVKERVRTCGALGSTRAGRSPTSASSTSSPATSASGRCRARPTTRRAPSRRRVEGLASRRPRPGRGRLFRPWHHRRHQRADPAPRRRHRPHHHRGLPRPARDRRASAGPISTTCRRTSRRLLVPPRRAGTRSASACATTGGSRRRSTMAAGPRGGPRPPRARRAVDRRVLPLQLRRPAPRAPVRRIVAEEFPEPS